MKRTILSIALILSILPACAENLTGFTYGTIGIGDNGTGSTTKELAEVEIVGANELSRWVVAADGAVADQAPLTYEYLESKISKLLKAALHANERAIKVEAKLQQFDEELDCAAKTVLYVEALKYKVAELERKVAGMQKQITVLHAKKVSK